jgi:hypothetical protein
MMYMLMVYVLMTYLHTACILTAYVHTAYMHTKYITHSGTCGAAKEAMFSDGICTAILSP